MNADLAAIQKVQNKLLRIVNNCKISDKISANSVLSINKLNSQIKLTEMWKANNKANYPLLLPKQASSDNNITTID